MRKSNHVRLRGSLNQNTKLYKHLEDKSEYYAYWFDKIMKVLGPVCNSCGWGRTYCPPIKN